MPFLKEITGLINTTLKSSTLSDKRFDKGSFYGIAKLLPRVEGERSINIPAIVDNDGTCTDVVIDDDKPFKIYHRIINLDYTKGDAFGDQQLITETASMLAIVYGDRNILKVEEAQLITAIQAGFLTELTMDDKDTYQLQKCSINITGINTDNQQVYSQEYSGDVAYQLKPNNIMVSIAYEIVSEYDKSCIDIC